MSLINRAVNFITRDLDYPISVRDFSLSEPNQDYYIDFAASFFDIYPAHRIVLDEKGVAMFDYSTVPPPNQHLGPQYSVTYICWYAISCLQKYLSEGDESYRHRFLVQSEWLKENCKVKEEMVYWSIDFDWEAYGVELPNPRVSSMDQGLAISILLRAYLLTGDNSYLELAKNARPFYEIPMTRGGFKAPFKNSFIYEMYPANPVSAILDGFVFSLMGLYDLYLTAGDKKALDLFEKGVKTIVDNLDYWDYNNVWSRFGRYYLSTPLYHKINQCWVEVLFRITGDERFKTTSENWKKGFKGVGLMLFIKLSSYFVSRSFLIRVAIDKYVNNRLSGSRMFFRKKTL